jgi:hypothetical protein
MPQGTIGAYLEGAFTATRTSEHRRWQRYEVTMRSTTPFACRMRRGRHAGRGQQAKGRGLTLPAQSGRGNQEDGNFAVGRLIIPLRSSARLLQREIQRVIQ